ncbi:MAG TPA: hypothetical protein VF393_07965 [archaeon]
MLNVDTKSLSLNEPLAILWTDDPVYAGYLVDSFGLLREQAVPAEARIQELLEQGPPQIDQ